MLNLLTTNITVYIPLEQKISLFFILLVHPRDIESTRTLFWVFCSLSYRFFFVFTLLFALLETTSKHSLLGPNASKKKRGRSGVGARRSEAESRSAREKKCWKLNRGRRAAASVHICIYSRINKHTQTGTHTHTPSAFIGLSHLRVQSYEASRCCRFVVKSLVVVFVFTCAPHIRWTIKKKIYE